MKVMNKKKEKTTKYLVLSITAEQLFLENLLVSAEGCNDFDIPYCHFNVSDVEITSNFLFF